MPCWAEVTCWFWTPKILLYIYGNGYLGALKFIAFIAFIEFIAGSVTILLAKAVMFSKWYLSHQQTTYVTVPLMGICSWYHSRLCLYLIHSGDHMGMKPLRIRFFFKSIHVIKWCFSVIASVWTWMEQIANIHGRPLMLMPFSHTQYPWSKTDADTAYEQYPVAARPRSPNSMKDAG